MECFIGGTTGTRFKNIFDFVNVVERMLIWFEKPDIFEKEKALIIKKERDSKIDYML